MTVTVDCPDLVATQALAARLAPLLRAGDVVLLSGGLGAGKTAFTQALGAALGVTEAVTSPTFVLVRRYATAAGFDLLHADVYRLERSSEILDLGLAELLEEDVCAVVEWGERARSAFGSDHLDLILELSADGATSRKVTLVPCGAGWADRIGALRELDGVEGVVDS